jgi:hypothetical protein
VIANERLDEKARLILRTAACELGYGDSYSVFRNRPHTSGPYQVAAMGSQGQADAGQKRPNTHRLAQKEARIVFCAFSMETTETRHDAARTTEVL